MSGLDRVRRAKHLLSQAVSRSQRDDAIRALKSLEDDFIEVKRCRSHISVLLNARGALVRRPPTSERVRGWLSSLDALEKVALEDPEAVLASRSECDRRREAAERRGAEELEEFRRRIERQNGDVMEVLERFPKMRYILLPPIKGKRAILVPPERVADLREALPNVTVGSLSDVILETGT